MHIYERQSSVIIDVKDHCHPIFKQPYQYSIQRDGSVLEPSLTRSKRTRDNDVQFFEEYAPGVTYQYCIQYVSIQAEYDFLDGDEYCQIYTVPWVATLTGSVKTPVSNRGTQAGVADVNICAYLLEDMNEGKPPFQCTTTELDGTYRLFVSQLWTGDSKDMVLIPSLEDHLFLTKTNLPPSTHVIHVPYRETVIP